MDSRIVKASWEQLELARIVRVLITKDLLESALKALPKTPATLAVLGGDRTSLTAAHDSLEKYEKFLSASQQPEIPDSRLDTLYARSSYGDFDLVYVLLPDKYKDTETDRISNLEDLLFSAANASDAFEQRKRIYFAMHNYYKSEWKIDDDYAGLILGHKVEKPAITYNLIGRLFDVGGRRDYKGGACTEQAFLNLLAKGRGPKEQICIIYRNKPAQEVEQAIHDWNASMPNKFIELNALFDIYKNYARKVRETSFAKSSKIRNLIALYE